MAIIDVVTFNGERDMLKLRLNILSKYVDQFIIVEAKTTFSGHEKPLYFSKQEAHFKQWWPQIKYHVIDENYSKEERDLARNSPNTVGARHWQREFLQKESIKKALAHLENDDIVYIGDVDEIWNPFLTFQGVQKLKLKVYAYWLNYRSDEQFWGPIRGTWGEMKEECLNHLRVHAPKTPFDAGWHFTSMGGFAEVRRKLNDSYTPESYNTAEVQRLLPQRLEQGVDYLGRNFTFGIDDTEWPSYLKTHRAKYAKLLK